MDLAQTLVRSVMRAFYETRHILVIEALIVHSALRDDDMAYLMGMNTKDLHKLCGKLREDRLLAVHVRPELKPNQTRPVNRTYYYIDYRQTIDAIKWRVYKIDKDMQGTTVPANERKEYFCNFCGAEWSQLEVIDNASAEGLRCHRCGHILVHDADRNSVGHQQSTRMNNQFKFITDLLPRIDSVVIPDNNFEVAYSNARPVIRDAANQVAQSVAVEPGLNRPTAVKGLANTGPKSMQVSISATDGMTEEEKAAERERKERIARQNALPSWMVNSTVTGESFTALGAGEGADVAVAAKDEGDGKEGASKQSLDAKEQADIEDYFARLKAEQAAEAARKAAEEEEEFESDDEDEGDFEDVVGAGITATNSAVGTPVVPSPLGQSASGAHLQSSLKREASGSGTSTGAASPTGGTSTPGSAERPAKKVKVQDPVPSPTIAAVNGDEEEDEDLEFEDV
ncbi:hypothetical protein VTK73DRAFT_10235 [Phialemonium thermophilum]|uniref:HTH TFE/IIEalpha-type domain-containing protein n=1 Tax=Phialemonium thermophilum TaxID=223376 RepID=A0ABR3XHZ2_9PEZI